MSSQNDACIVSGITKRVSICNGFRICAIESGYGSLPLQPRKDGRWQAQKPSAGRKQDALHLKPEDGLPIPLDDLAQNDACLCQFGRRRMHFEYVVDAGSLQEVSVEAAHREHGRLPRKRSILQSIVGDAEEAHIVGAPTLAPAHIGGMINKAGKVRVFEIDPDWQDVSRLRKTAGKISPIRAAGLSRHRPETLPSSPAFSR